MSTACNPRAGGRRGLFACVGVCIWVRVHVYMHVGNETSAHMYLFVCMLQSIDKVHVLFCFFLSRT